jgi:plastocyanin
MILGGVFLLVSAGGLVSLGPSLDHGTAEAAPKLGPAKATVAVVAEPTTKFDAETYTAPAGVVRFEYSGAPNHTLAIQDPQFADFVLKSSGGPRSGKVDLPPGKYTLYCTITGHEAQGMKATLTVTK